MDKKRTKKEKYLIDTSGIEPLTFKYPCQFCKGKKSPFNIDYNVLIYCDPTSGKHFIAEDKKDPRAIEFIMGTIKCPHCRETLLLIHRGDFTHRLG